MHHRAIEEAYAPASHSNNLNHCAGDTEENAPKDIKKKQLESFRFANATFPFYLKLEYHDMSLAQLETSKGEYWGDAAHFLLSNKAHGFPLWSEFEKQIRSVNASVSCKPHISVEMAKQILNHQMIQQQRESGTIDFALDPFVLTQLPFQPVLLLQWLALSMYRVLEMELDMVMFYAIPVPVKFKPRLMRLHNLLKSTQRDIGFLFDYLQHQVESEQEIFVGNLKVFEIILGRVYTFLKFWLYNKCNEYICDLKTKCWKNWKLDGKQYQLVKGKMPLKSRNFLFNPDFWRTPGPKLNLFGNSNEILVRAVHQDETDDEIWPEAEKMEAVRGIVLTAVGGAGIKNFNYDDLMQTNVDFKNMVCKLKRRLRFGNSIDKDDSGIIGTILNTKYALEFKTAISESDWETSHFAARIKRTVMKCLKDHHLKSNDYEKKDDVVRDWQVAQYLLPCFVALYRVILIILVTAKESQNDLTVWYAKFLDKLIGTYEDKNLGFRKSSWKNILEDIEATPALRESYYEKKHEKLLDFFDEVSRKFVKKIKTCQTAFGHLDRCKYFKAFYEVLEKSCGKNKTPSNDIATEPSVYWNWLMWDFFGRMEKAMEEESSVVDN
ncbi:Hypothetical predicted protein [Cloeon dipterum]|uniref:Uncharacterized protein n=1 Tax=Cloeon dipterum TaxID=197152 RepID=A0A8S1DW60_9INSE|nr:Hypothetical predicted protein [Cloeon dipterum]